METPPLEHRIRAMIEQLQPLPMLPLDLIAEILTWLPVDSLLRFRCVSKWFKTLISSRDFVKAHLRSMKALSTVKPNRVDRLFRRSMNFVQHLIKPERSPPVIDWGSHSWLVDSLYNGPPIEGVELVDVSKRVDGGDWVVGSCDGMLCSVPRYHGVVVWNPTTRVIRELPTFHYDDVSGEQMHRCHKVFGFGYDCQHDDYKVVVVISYPRNGTDHEFESQVQVFALKSKSWRRIEDFKYGVPVVAGVKFVAGRLYYKVVPSFEGERDEWRDTLVSLDLATEEYNNVKLPDFGDTGTYWAFQSLVDRLCLASFDYDDSCEVWVMKEPRVTESWTKLFRVDRHVVDAGLRAPLYISDNGEALWDNYEDLFIYSSKDNTVRSPTSRGLADRHGPAVIYMETLVSPRLNNYQTQL